MFELIIVHNHISGVGIDLVCLGEQPLHAVPLIKFISSKSKSSSEDTYNVPQWINLSYYSKPNSKSSVFVPRMTVPEKPPPEEICMYFLFFQYKFLLLSLLFLSNECLSRVASSAPMNYYQWRVLPSLRKTSKGAL